MREWFYNNGFGGILDDYFLHYLNGHQQRQVNPKYLSRDLSDTLHKTLYDERYSELREKSGRQFAPLTFGLTLGSAMGIAPLSTEEGALVGMYKAR